MEAAKFILLKQGIKMITEKIIGDQLLSYLQHRLSLDELINWAENELLDSNYEDDAEHTLRNALAQLGLADVKALDLNGKIVSLS